jgi:phage gpG-like protein
MQAIGESLINSTAERFVSQTDPEGNAWQALTESYKARKRYNKDKILTLTGMLSRSFHIADVRATGVTVASDRDYAPYLQPARPFMGFSGDDKNEIRETILDYLLDR